MDKTNSAIIACVVLVLILLVCGGVWFHEMQEPVLPSASAPLVGTSIPQQATSSSQQQFSLSCPQNSSTSWMTYADQGSGFAFCYPSDLTVSTDTDTGTHVITWPASYTDPFFNPNQNVFNPRFIFTTERSDSSSVAATVPQCDFSGARGDTWCVPPDQSQVLKGISAGGLSFALFRADLELNDTIENTSTGPYAFVALSSSTFLIFQTPVAFYPPYVESDLKEILSTVVVLPSSATPVPTISSSTAASSSSSVICAFDFSDFAISPLPTSSFAWTEMTPKNATSVYGDMQAVNFSSSTGALIQSDAFNTWPPINTSLAGKEWFSAGGDLGSMDNYYQPLLMQEGWTPAQTNVDGYAISGDDAGGYHGEIQGYVKINGGYLRAMTEQYLTPGIPGASTYSIVFLSDIVPLSQIIPNYQPSCPDPK